MKPTSFSVGVCFTPSFDLQLAQRGIGNFGAGEESGTQQQKHNQNIFHDSPSLKKLYAFVGVAFVPDVAHKLFQKVFHGQNANLFAVLIYQKYHMELV